MLNTRRLFQLLAKTTTTTTRTRTKVAFIQPLIPTASRLFFTTTASCKSTMVHDKTCWQCQSTNKPSALFCENKVCSVIQPVPAQLNFYHLLQAGEGENK
jgi:hypothetical protein